MIARLEMLLAPERTRCSKSVQEAGKEDVPAKRPPVIKAGVNTVTALVENKEAQLVVISDEEDPSKRLVFLSAQCQKMGVPYCNVKSKPDRATSSIRIMQSPLFSVKRKTLLRGCKLSNDPELVQSGSNILIFTSSTYCDLGRRPPSVHTGENPAWPVMDVDQGPMSDTIITVTLEVVHLLTGEDYMVVKKSGDFMIPSAAQELRRTQTSIMVPSPHTLIEETNDRKILELTNRIIHLLTGEVWKYLGNLAVASDHVMEHHQQIGPLGSPEDFQTNHVPDEVKRESGTCKGIDVENNALMCPLTQDTNGLNEVGKTSSERETLVDIDSCAPTKLMHNHGAFHIKEELVPPTSQAQNLPNRVKKESNLRKVRNLKDSKMCTATGHTLQYYDSRIKMESGLFQEENELDGHKVFHQPSKLCYYYTLVISATWINFSLPGIAYLFLDT
ncbi:uncharacterized protein [Dendrobates tinctorius]|uniref:uncharacterized protein n=1 Tax=Dendrobates tinctorius TaxID=92724 RepID=UPI003CC9630F